MSLPPPAEILQQSQLPQASEQEEERMSWSAASSRTSPPFIDPMALEVDEKELTRNLRWALLASMKAMPDYFTPFEGNYGETLPAARGARRSEIRRDRPLECHNPMLLEPGAHLTMHSMPATPMTRATLPPSVKPLMPWAPELFQRRWRGSEQKAVIDIQRQQPTPSSDYWIYFPKSRELARVHVVPRTLMFDPFVLDRSDPIYEIVMVRQMPVVKDGTGPINESWFTGVRSTQLIYLHNPISSWHQGAHTPQEMNEVIQANFVGDPEQRERTGVGLHDFVMDNIFWTGWNTRQHMGAAWQGVTRFEVRHPDDMIPSTMATWMEARYFAEDLWRMGQEQMRWFRLCTGAADWQNAQHAEPLAETFQMSSEQWQDYWINATADLVTSQGEIAEAFYNFVNAAVIKPPEAHREYRGLTELTHGPQEALDAPKPETGKLRLELKWSDLSPVWQKAFEEPIIEAIKIYFSHEAISPVTEEEVVDVTEILPSRFVLVNKADPRNSHPTDEQLEGAKLKARWKIAGHRDQRAGEFETEAPTASLLGHNLLCFFATQWSWTMSFADVSAAFLQGDLLPEERRVFVQCPRNYPNFVRQYLRAQVPQDCRTDLFRMRKAGFGLAESPRLWYKKFKRDIESIGGKEWRLMPGVFSFFQDGEVYAMLAVHVDDVRLVVDQDKEKRLKGDLNGLFSFGEWKTPREWTRFCGRYERQFENGVVQLQMNDYATRISEPPMRRAGQDTPSLLPNEKKWIGTICGQLNWMARQCRADLTFGVSRVQQLAGVNDPAALVELKILVDRAKEETLVNFKKLHCSLDKAIVIGASDASFASMPRGRSQGGYVIMIANPEILDGEAAVNVVTYHSGLLKRVVRSSLAAEISQAASTMEEADFVRAVMAEAVHPDFRLSNWVSWVSQWRQILVLDSRTGYDLLNGSSLGEDRRLAIDIAAMKQALQEDGASRMVRWVPGEELPADDLTKLKGNQRLLQVMKRGCWALKDTPTAKKLRADAAARKRTYRQKIVRLRDEAEDARRK